MPAGMGVIMIVSPYLLESVGWRGTWLFLSVVTFGWMLLLGFLLRGLPVMSNVSHGGSVKSVIFNVNAILMFTTFIAYSSLFTPIGTLLPTLLVGQKQMLLTTAGLIGAVVVVSNIIGNFASGWLIRHGIKPRTLLLLAFVMMGGCGSLVFFDAVSPFGKMMFGMGFAATGGLIPGTLFVIIGRISAVPAHVAILAGVLLQGAGIGQFIGPTVATLLVEHFADWQYAAGFMIVAGVVGIILSFILGSRLARQFS